jgi:hypothetical protein
MSLSIPIFELSLEEYLHRLSRRIQERRELMVQSADQLSDDELNRMADEDETDLKALADLRGTRLADIRAKAAPLSDRELEDIITSGELALIMSILTDLTR